MNCLIMPLAVVCSPILLDVVGEKVCRLVIMTTTASQQNESSMHSTPFHLDVQGKRLQDKIAAKGVLAYETPETNCRESYCGIDAKTAARDGQEKSPLLILNLPFQTSR